MTFISVDEVKQQANITTSKFDDELEDYAEAACSVVEEWCGVIEPATFTEVVDIPAFPGSPSFITKERPILSVISLSSYPAGITTDPILLGVDEPTGIITKLSGASFYSSVTITYRAGYDPIPSWAALAAKIIAAHMWRTQRGGRTSGQDDAGNVAGVGYLVPNQAAALLEPHRKAPGIG